MEVIKYDSRNVRVTKQNALRPKRDRFWIYHQMLLLPLSNQLSFYIDITLDHRIYNYLQMDLLLLLLVTVKLELSLICSIFLFVEPFEARRSLTQEEFLLFTQIITPLTSS